MKKLGRIERDIPMPSLRNGYGIKYRWSEMEIGDSMLIGAKTIDGGRSMAHKASQSLGRKFECRRTKDGMRVWRTA